MRLIFCWFSLILSNFASAVDLLGNITLPVEFYNIHVDYQNPEKVFSDFKEFIVKFKRDYKTLEEHQFRFNEFVKSHNKVITLNLAAKEKGHNTVYGINHFSDRTEEEFRKVFSHVMPVNISSLPKVRFNVNGTKSKRSKRQSDLPASFDLRDINVKGSPIIGPIKNQGECGCCWGFCSTAVAEAANAIDSGRYVALSDQELCDCGTSSKDGEEIPGCTGGDLGVGLTYIGRYGLASEQDYEYVDGRSKTLGQCDMRYYRRSMRSRTIKYHAIESDNIEQAIMRQLVQYNVPVATFFRVGEGIKEYHYGVIGHEDCKNTEEVEWHSCPIIGYGTEEYLGQSLNYWILRNSWAVDWGEDGYFRVLRGMNWCLMEDKPVTARLYTGGGYFDYNDY